MTVGGKPPTHVKLVYEDIQKEGVAATEPNPEMPEKKRAKAEHISGTMDHAAYGTMPLAIPTLENIPHRHLSGDLEAACTPIMSSGTFQESEQ